MNLKMQKGFTLVELLVTLALLAILAVVALTAINPLEQLRRVKDSANMQNATNFLNAINRYQATKGKDPQILASANSSDCQDTVSAGPVYDYISLRDELSDWFGSVITEPGAELYTGFDGNGSIKVCFRVNSAANIAKTPQSGCTILPYSYLCFPE